MCSHFWANAQRRSVSFGAPLTERRGLDAEVAQDAEHQRDVQQDRDDRAEVLGSGRIDVVAPHRGLHQQHHALQQQRPTIQKASAASTLSAASIRVVDANVCIAAVSMGPPFVSSLSTRPTRALQARASLLHLTRAA